MHTAPDGILKNASDTTQGNKLKITQKQCHSKAQQSPHYHIHLLSEAAR